MERTLCSGVNKVYYINIKYTTRVNESTEKTKEILRNKMKTDMKTCHWKMKG